jgi:hypothetical protein
MGWGARRWGDGGRGESEGNGKPESKPAGGWLALCFGWGCCEFWACGLVLSRSGGGLGKGSGNERQRRFLR